MLTRVDQLKKLKARHQREPYAWIPVTELGPGDRFCFGGDWFRVLNVTPVEDHRLLSAASDTLSTVIDYLACEAVKVALPRPSGPPEAA